MAVLDMRVGGDGLYGEPAECVHHRTAGGRGSALCAQVDGNGIYCGHHRGGGGGVPMCGAVFGHFSQGTATATLDYECRSDRTGLIQPSCDCDRLDCMTEVLNGSSVVFAAEVRAHSTNRFVHRKFT